MLELKRRDLVRADVFIAGQWTPAAEGQRFAVLNPADGSLVAQVADAGEAEAGAAVDAASAALPAWRALPAKARSAILRRWFAALEANAGDLATLISLEQGKPRAEALGEVAYGASYVQWFAEEAVRADGEVIPAPAGDRRILTVREGVGVVAAITPWNFPIAMLARKIAPALAAGCTVVAKPAEDTPLSALAIALLAAEAGVPDGVINVVPASRGRTPAISDAWMKDERVRKVSFTGSTAVGKLLAAAASGTLKRLSLELGGNAPFIVFDDADLDAAVAGAMTAKFRNAGQTCVSPNRLLVQSGIYDAFAARLAQAVGGLKVGPASQDGSQIGPLINDRAVAKFSEHVADALDKGATLLTGGRAHALGGSFVEPTVIGDMTTEMAASQEETFGPLAGLYRFETEADAIALANDTPFGLAAYFYSRDIARVWRVADALEVGMIGINEGAISNEAAPFGGVKQSGYGREGSSHGLSDYQNIKYLCMGGLG